MRIARSFARPSFPTVLLIVVTLITAHSQQATTDDELRRTTEGLYQAALAARTTTTPATLLTSATWLRDSVRQPAFWNGPLTRARDVSPEYMQSLRMAEDLLKRGAPPQVQVAIADDLEAKVDHCRTLNIGMGGTIAIRVNTRRGDGTVANLQVKYLLKFYESFPNAQPGTFARLSSPTEMPLPPGLYWIWAIDPATGRSSQRTLVRAAGQRQLVVDVPVP
jgi:hypothetical protein